MLSAFILASCEDTFRNPMKDKESGEDINLLIVDFNFFKTHLTVNLLDANTQSRISVPGSIAFSGKNGNDIVNYSGNRKSSYPMTEGQLELTVDPNVKPSSAEPLEFSVSASADGYNTLSKTISFRSDGKKTIDIFLSKKTDESGSQLGGEVVVSDGDTTVVFGISRQMRIKSASQEKPFRIKYTLTINDFLKLKDTSGNLLFSSAEEFMLAYNQNPENFLYIHVNTFNNYPSWPDVMVADGIRQNVILKLLETGTIDYMSVGGTRVGSFNGAVMTGACEWISTEEPSRWGYAVYQDDAWLFQGKSRTITAFPHTYNVVSATEASLCPSGAVIRFEAGFKSGFSITADIKDMQGKLIYTQNFTGNFPASFTLENVPDVPATLVFRDNNSSFKAISNLEVGSLCSGNHTVNVQQKEGYSSYQIVLKAYCENNPLIAIAPTYSGEYRIKGSSDPWQGGFMQGGVLDLLGKPDQEYEYRLLWENEWETSAFHSRFNADGTYPYTSDSKITSEKLPDGRIRINISHIFRQKVCDTLNW